MLPRALRTPCGPPLVRFCQAERHITFRCIVEPFTLSIHFGGSTMFDRLLKQPHALAAHRNGPLAEERRQLPRPLRRAADVLGTACEPSPATRCSSPRLCVWPSDPANSSPEPRSRPRRTAGSVAGPGCRECGRTAAWRVQVIQGPCGSVAHILGAVAATCHSAATARRSGR